MKKNFLLFALIVVFVATTDMSASKKVLFVQAQATTPNASDANIIAALTAKGYEVTMIDDDKPGIDDALATDVVVISSTVSSGKVTKFAWITKPIINWEPGAMDDFGLVFANLSSGFTITTMSILVGDNTSHPMLKGFADGTNLVSTTSSFAILLPYVLGTKPARVLATTDSTTPTSAWILWETGDDLDPATSTYSGYPADGKSVGIRIFVPFTDNFFATVNDLGMKILLNSVEYATTGTVISSIEKPTLSNNSIYPNPAKNLIYVKAEDVKTISIYNTLGMEVLKVKNDYAKGVNISNLPAGSYIVNTTTNKGIISSKLIKE